VSREEKAAYRLDVWERIRRYARPDSRFHWDFSKFIPDFKGSERCAERIRRLPTYRRARLLFITPDNCLEADEPQEDDEAWPSRHAYYGSLDREY
jgi:5-formyltetrahydrofolate cyclo-ligase